MGPVSIEFMSNGFCVQGEVYPAASSQPAATFLFIPGWPGRPEDRLDLGPRLAKKEINFCWINPRGVNPSGGELTHSGTLQDIGAALRWLRQADVQKQFNIEPSRLVLGGYSYGGGMAVAYAALDTSVQRVISIAGTDHAVFIKELKRNRNYAAGVRSWLARIRYPEGPVHFDIDAVLKELSDYPEIFGWKENAARLTDRSLLLIGGWEDEGPSIDRVQLPFYRALKSGGASDVTFLVYHTDHTFKNVRRRLAADVARWILRS